MVLVSSMLRNLLRAHRRPVIIFTCHHAIIIIIIIITIIPMITVAATPGPYSGSEGSPSLVLAPYAHLKLSTRRW